MGCSRAIEPVVRRGSNRAIESIVSGAIEPVVRIGCRIVIVSAKQRPQYDKCKAKEIALLTGDVKVEMLGGTSVGTYRIL
jgi:hypothetical protein